MKVSIIVPIYNVEKYLHRCIDSILDQTFTNFELILVDDGSPDKCGEICDEYSKKDSRIHVIHKENGGLSDARNNGIDWAFANSDSEWLTFIDSDDWIHPKYLEYLYRGVTETNCQISICSYEETTGESPTVDESSIEIETVDTETFFCERNVNAVVAWGKLYRKELFKDIRYPFGKLHEDEFTTYKLLFQCEKLAWINAPMYAYFNNEFGITKTYWNPRRMDILMAITERSLYFENTNFTNAYIHSIKASYTLICINYRRMKENKKYSQFSEGYHILKKAARITLKLSIENKISYIYKEKLLWILSFTLTRLLYNAYSKLRNKYNQYSP